MIKMIATDIDGTIYNLSYGDFTPRVKQCINNLNKKGIKIILVTGRMHRSASKLADELGIKTPIVSYQGGMIKENSENGQIYYQKNLSKSYTNEIIEWARKNKIHINLYMDDILYVENDCETIKKYTKARYIEYKVCSFDELEIKNVNKILAINYNDADIVTEWVNYLQNKYPELYIVKSTPYFCEISHKDARKSFAVEYLCNKWGIKKEEVLTIGDQNNDIELLKTGGIKVAMGNGTPELKNIADYITDTVENDGFVKAIKKYIEE